MAPKRKPAPIKSDWLAGPAAVWLAAALLGFAVYAGYHNSLGGPFVFDDGPSIVENQSLRSLHTALMPPGSVGETVAGRPVLNLSFALNYAWGGLEVRGYHFVNLLLHTVAGLLLFGLVRRTLLRPVLREKWGPAALPLAVAVALVWLLHPLQTESVTYVVQRAESLAGLFYLLTLYAFVRSVDSPRPAGWQGLSLAACLLGMGTKEVMVSAPLLVLLYDRTFAAGSFVAAGRLRGRFYLGLAGTWLLLGGLVVAAGGRGATAGLNTDITWWSYALTQCRAVGLYLRLAVWPEPLVFDHGTGVVKNFAEVWPPALGLAVLAVGTGFALWRRPALGFLGAWFLALLAPSSSVVPVATQTVAEHRLYLALAALVAAAVLGLHAWLGRKSAGVWLLVAAGFCFLTDRRNADYRSEEALWRDTVAKVPENPRARTNLGVVLAESGRPEEAITQYEAAQRSGAYSTELHNNLGTAYAQVGRGDEAIGQFQAALQQTPSSARAHYNLGTILAQRGRLAEAAGHLEAALRTEPVNANAHSNLGNVLYQTGQFAAAHTHYAEALRLDPEQRNARAGLARLELRGKTAPPSR